MRLEVDAVLDGRSGRSPRRQQATALAVAFTLHALAVTAAFAVPRLTQQEREYPEYVAVQVLPAAALGVERPRPAPAPPPPEPEPAPDPEPQPELPDPELPTLPDEEPEPAPEPQPAPPPAPAPQPDRPSGRQGASSGTAGDPRSLGAQVSGPGGSTFAYDYYLDQMLGKIRQSWVRPPVEGIETVITFRVLPDGELVDVEIRESSGSRAFDLAALRAVRNASPLPPLPSSYREDHLSVNLIVR